MGKKRKQVKDKFRQSICAVVSEFIKEYKTKGVVIEPQEIVENAYQALSNAILSYFSLIEPKTSKISVYVEYWVREELRKDFILKTLTPIKAGKTNDGNNFHYSLIQYLNLLPPEKMIQIKNEIFTPHSLVERKEKYNKYNSVLNQLLPIFQKVVVDRTKLAVKQGFKNYLELIIKQDNISNSQFVSFSKIANRVIKKCNREIQDLEINNLGLLSNECYICKSSVRHVDIPEEVFSLATKKFPILRKFQAKIKVGYSDKVTTFFNKEKDIFEINLLKNTDFRHQLVFLAHELGHVVYFLETFKKGNVKEVLNKYLSEKSAYQFELALSKQLSQSLYRSVLYGILEILHRTLFELDIYSGSDQDFAYLYADSYNRCFLGAKQTASMLFLLDKQIVMNPLSSLPHAMAATRVLLQG